MTPPVQTRKKVLVVGGGVGGMEAAIQAAKRGHEVTLCEKTDKLGGVLNCEDKVPFKQNMPVYLKRQARLLDVYNVDVRLNTEVTPGYAEDAGADVIIAALGARPVVPSIPGIKFALGAEEVFMTPEKAEGTVAILGAGLVGIELAIWLAQLGHAVKIIEMAEKPGVDYNKMEYLAYRIMLEDLGIRLYLGKKAVSISQTGIDTDCNGVSEHFDADTVIYAVGQRPLSAETDALASCASEFFAIGDCVRPESILEATSSAYGIACGIGRV